jgi:uncharacterized protein (TIGR02679 family)
VSGNATTPIPAQILTWAAEPGPARVLAAARTRLEKGQRGNRLTLVTDLSSAERAEMSPLLGLPWRGSGAPVTLGTLRTALAAAGVAIDDLLTAVTGEPVRDLSAEQSAARAARADAASDTRAILAAAGLSAPIAKLTQQRWLGPHEEQLPLARNLQTVLAALPLETPTLLPVIADALLNDPHALDKSTYLGRATARVLAASAEANADALEDDDTDGTDVEMLLLPPSASAAAGGRAAAAAAATALEPDRWRQLWASVGIICDRVSSNVLTLNLPLTKHDVESLTDADRLADLASACLGEPMWVTARMVPPTFGLAAGSLSGVSIRVCENPAIIECIADEFGRTAPPMVCTYGQPSSAARTLLAALAAAGAHLFVTADRDHVGQIISTSLLDALPGAQPWLPNAHGTYEEGRLAAMIEDIRFASRSAPATATTHLAGADESPESVAPTMP